MPAALPNWRPRGRREPLDSDVQASGARPPAPIAAVDLLAVVVGGAAGSLSRYAVTLFLPSAAGIDWPLVVVNLVGACCLGLLVEVLTRRAPADGGEPTKHRRLRLLVGTGYLGGFTTYSALAVGTLDPVGSGGFAVSQLVLIVLGGLLAAAVGMGIGARMGRRRP